MKKPKNAVKIHMSSRTHDHEWTLWKSSIGSMIVCKHCGTAGHGKTKEDVKDGSYDV